MLFGCEGETEVEYLRAYCQSRRIHGEFPKSITGLDPAQLVEKTQRAFDADYDLAACVFDRDQHATYDRAVAEVARLAGRARKPIPIVAAVSHVSFELWILMHLERTDKPFASSNEVIEHIQQHHIPDYTKARAVELVPHVGVARDNADWLMGRYQANGQTGSLTTMHLLIDRLEAIAGAPAQ